MERGKDFLEQEVKVGDLVLYMGPGYKKFKSGKVIKVTPSGFTIGNDSWDGWVNRGSHMVIKHPTREFRIIDDLPEKEQQPFREWLAYQTRPINKDGTCGFYECDYDTWKAGLEPLD